MDDVDVNDADRIGVNSVVVAMVKRRSSVSYIVSAESNGWLYVHSLVICPAKMLHKTLYGYRLSR